MKKINIKNILKKTFKKKTKIKVKKKIKKIKKVKKVKIKKVAEKKASLKKVRKDISIKSSEKLRVLKSHPDLALGKVKTFNKLTISSKTEQKNAGLTSLTEKEQNDFNELNYNYKKKFKHPFIIAIKGKTRSQILRQFKNRLNNSKQEEDANEEDNLPAEENTEKA